MLKREMSPLLSLNDLNFGSKVPGHRLSGSIPKENGFEPRSNRIRSTDELPLSQRIQSLCRALRGQQKRSFILLLEPVFDDGIRPTDISREPSRYRSLPACTSEQSLSLRPDGSSQTLDIGRRKRESRLEDLRRFCTQPDSDSSN